MNFNIRVFILIYFLIFSCSSCHAAPNNTEEADRAFFSLADEYFQQSYFPAHPTDATLLGIHQYDGKLEGYTKSQIDAEVAVLKQFEAKVLSINPKQLSQHVNGDLLLVLNHIRSRLLTAETIKPWENNPDYYSSGITMAAFSIIERQFAPDEERIQALIEREKQMPSVLAEAHKNIKNPAKIFTEIAIEQLPGLISFFKNQVPLAFKAEKNVELINQLNKSNDAVVKALIEYQAWLNESVLKNSKGDFRIGAEVFRKKLAYDEMVDTPLDELLAINLENMKKNQNDFLKLAKEIDPNISPRAVLIKYSKSPAPTNLLMSFSDTFDELIHFIQEKKIITIPSMVPPIMEETPPFLRAMTFASMDTPGPFEDKATEAYFNVTLPAKDWEEQKIKEYMEKFNYSTIAITSIHEAYPGHYVQFLWMKMIDDPVRKILGASTNAEGWAHYCEQMMLDEGYQGKTALETKLLRLSQLSDALWRNARFAVGIQLHTGKMTFDEAIDFFVKEAYQPRIVGLIETKRATSDPTYLYYTLGKLQILKLRKEIEKKEGASFSLLKFHDDFMRQGFPPIKIVRAGMLGSDLLD